MNKQLTQVAEQTVQEMFDAGLYKTQRIISGKQGACIVANGKEVINFCSNNYLGLSGRQELITAAKTALDTYGYGLSSVRFICGTQTIHKEVEKKIATYLHQEDAIIFTSCWDANEAVFAALLNEEDAIISDELNHASIIDGIRLCKASRHVYTHMDMSSLEETLQSTMEKRLRCIVTDGVFSMDGDIAPLKNICDLADKYNACVMVDDSHATGFVGSTGRGTIEAHDVMNRVDIVTTTFGKALGGANGGCIAAKKSIIDVLHQKARTTLFTNTVPPMVAATTCFVLDFLDQHPELREKLWENTVYFREQMSLRGFTLPSSVHPIVPIRIGDGGLAMRIANDLFEKGIYVIGFSYPVVPMNKSRIRVQISAVHTKEQIDMLVHAFETVGSSYQLIH